jgi:hypothetical protein
VQEVLCTLDRHVVTVIPVKSDGGPPCFWPFAVNLANDDKIRSHEILQEGVDKKEQRPVHIALLLRL